MIRLVVHFGQFAPGGLADPGEDFTEPVDHGGVRAFRRYFITTTMWKKMRKPQCAWAFRRRFSIRTLGL